MASREWQWIPFLSDNIYRIAGVGSATPVAELRQSVKRLEATIRVGLYEKPPLSNLLASPEPDILGQHIQTIAADPLKRTCHRLMWFLQIDGKQEVDLDSLDECCVLDSEIAQAQFNYLEPFLRFVDSKQPEDLEEALERYSEFYYDVDIDEQLADMLVEESRSLSYDKSSEIVEQAQQIVAHEMLTYATRVAIQLLEQGQQSHAEKILHTILNSPIDDEWEDRALLLIVDYLRPIVDKVEQTHKEYEGWKPGYKNPVEAECEMLFHFASLLEGRVTHAGHWRHVAQEWIDTLALSMSNYAVQAINARVAYLQKVNNLPIIYKRYDLRDIIIDLVTKLLEAEIILKKAMELKVSSEVRLHLSRVLQDTQQMLSQAAFTVKLEAEKRIDSSIKLIKQSTNSSEKQENIDSFSFILLLILIFCLLFCIYSVEINK